MRKLLLSIMILAAPAASAQTHVRTMDVLLSSFDYSPQEIRLRAGEPVVLRLINTSNGGHNFAAPGFFAAANIAEGAAAVTRQGAIEVRPKQTVAVRLVPARGLYRLRCTHLLHSAFGMRGRIIVE